MLHRVLGWFNYLVGVALLTSLSVIYWCAWRPLPKTSGSLEAPVGAAATIARDALGVPHISAATIEDLFFLQGFVHAQDRLWQMDATRRRAAGELAEIAGPRALDSDRESRRLRMRRAAERHAAGMSPPDRAMFAAYARGVNFFIETNRGRLAAEFTLLDYEPRPWSVADSVLVALEMARTLTTNWKSELEKADLAGAGDAAKVNYLYPVRAGGETLEGSNAWALAGTRTATGKPLLANDPHLENSIPSPWYLVHLKAQDLNAAGASIPGLPAILLGHNERIAWGASNLGFDVQDLYREKMDPQSGRYLFRGQPEQARVERETIAVARQRPVEMQVWVTRHGPLLLPEAGLAMRWLPAEEFQFPLLDLNRARNWREFTAALARYSWPALSFVYADTDGNIGYQAAGRLPIRGNYDGDVPADGASGEFEWEGFIPFEQLPSLYNPPSGLLVAANQNPFPAAYPYRVGGRFAAPYRARQIRDLLAARKGWRASEMLAVQKDVYSPFSDFLARQAVAAYGRRGARNPALAGAVAVLRSWNGQMEKGAPAGMLVTLLYQHVRKAVAESAAPGKGLAYSSGMAASVIERLLRERPAGWFPDYDQMLLRAFTDAIEEGRRIQGRDVQKWDYGRYNEMRVRNPVLGRLPLIGAYFDLGPARMSGSSSTVKQATRVLGPSMRMIADLADWDRSLANVLTGQSGQVLSSHYKDQWEAHYAARGLPLPFGRVEAKDVLRVTPAAR